MSKVSSGMSSLFKIAENMAKGVDQYVSEPVKSSRLDKCNKCPHLMKTRQCAECYCFVDMKTKYKQEKCPIGKWEAIAE